MTAAQNDSGRSARSGLHLWVALLLALLLLVSWFMGYGPGGSKCAPVAQASVGAAAAVQSSAQPAEPAPGAAVPAAAAPAAIPTPTASAAPDAALTPAAPATAPMAPAPLPTSPPASPPVAELAGTTTASAPTPATPPTLTPTPTPTPKPETSPSVVPRVSVVPVAKVYFAVEKASLPKTSGRDLARVVKYLKANPRAKAFVSGFHDPSGNRANNENLALRRAQAVAIAMQKMGIAKQRILLQKPEQTVGSGKSAEARRVEVDVVRS